MIDIRNLPKENKPMNFKHLNKFSLVALIALASFSVRPAIGEEPLKVFILAGQSNTVGHARAHTIATLFPSSDSRDQELVQMVFDSESGISRKTLEDQLTLGKNIDELTGGISNDKIKKMADGPEKTALQAKVDKLKEAHESYKKKVSAACATSNRVYINSIADRNKKSGKLGIGYGADDLKIGPEYGFGLSIAEQVDGPILLIKTSWGGKSLNYNFRPPSLPDFKTTPEYEEAKAKANENLKRYEAAVKSFPQDVEKYKADLAAYEKQMKTADEKARKKLRQPREPREPRKPKPFNMDEAGLNYRMMNEAIQDVLANLKDNHPEYDAEAGYKIAGFVWFQGYNDQFSPEFRDNYKDNMITFIKDVRKEYKEPNLPFVIGVLGTGVTAEKVAENQVSLGQREAAKAPEFKDNVASVESYTEYSHYSDEVFKKGWPEHYHEWDTVGSDRPYHYLGSGAFFVRLGDAFADSIAELIAKQNN
ncbi:MAG: sialate O-acetylesterase [Mariniblastus sp.]